MTAPVASCELEIQAVVGAMSTVCVSCERSFAGFRVVDLGDGEPFDVCELCLPVLGGCNVYPAG